MEILVAETRIDLNCALHGGYQKFVNDETKECPQCQNLQAVLEEKKIIEKQSIKSHLAIVKVVVQCDEHGDSHFEVPVFMRDKVGYCPQCVTQKRTDKLKPKIKRAVDDLLKESGIPVNYLDQRFSNLDATKSPKQQRIVTRLSEYVLDLKKSGDSVGDKNILLSGNMGTGKTLYASILLKEILSRSVVAGVADEKDIKFKGGMSALFISEPDLLNSITATWKPDGESTKSLLNRLAMKSILCIDDVGAVTTIHTHLLDFYASLIDERYKRRLPTVLTSNLSANDLRLAIGARSADRFLEKNRIIIANFDWNGYRGGSVDSGEIEVF